MKKRTTNAQTRTDYIVVTNADTNELGILPVCGLLQAISRHNDAITTSFYGTSSLTRIHCRHYHVAFSGNATTGNTLHITSVWQQNNGQLEVQLTVSKKEKGKIQTICTGRFSFVYQLALAS